MWVFSWFNVRLLCECGLPWFENKRADVACGLDWQSLSWNVLLFDTKLFLDILYGLPCPAIHSHLGKLLH